MTVDQFAELAKAFDDAYWEIIGAEVDFGIARGRLLLAQREATALLMAYGHGVRGRFGQRSEMERSIPELWPKAKPISARRIRRGRVRIGSGGRRRVCSTCR